MKTYGKAEIENFLLAIDEEMKSSFDLIIIGGTAAALGYSVLRYTKDIDTVNKITAIETAYEKAKLKTGLNIPMGPTGVEDGPCNYYERLIEYSIPGLKKLRILLPEKHDLVLMKTVRGYAHDLEAAEEIHRKNPLSFDTLV